jgi:hypothetical protein
MGNPQTRRHLAMFDQIDRALSDSLLPCMPLAASRRNSGDAEWDDPDALIEDEYEDELDDDDTDDVADDDLDEDDEDEADDDLDDTDVSFEGDASLDELGEEEEEALDDGRDDWDA